MSEGSKWQESSRIEHELEPKYKQETVQYQDGQLALKITGERGARFVFDGHKYSPTEYQREGIITTKSGNDYYIFTNGDYTYVVNIRETARKGKLVAGYKEFPAELPPVKFGKPWIIPGFYETSDIVSLLLKHKITTPDQNIGRKINGRNPFDTYKDLLKRYSRTK